MESNKKLICRELLDKREEYEMTLGQLLERIENKFDESLYYIEDGDLLDKIKNFKD